MSLNSIRTFHRNSGKLRISISSFSQFSYNPVLGRRLVKTDETKVKVSLVKRISQKLFGKYLLTTNIVGSGILMIFGDWAAQEIEYQRGLTTTRCDLTRVGRMFLVGALQGPMHHYFYKWMDTILPVVTMSSVFKKIALDQFVMSPVCIVMFFYSAGWLEGKNTSQCNLELNSKFLTVYTVDWLVWPFAQFCNFYWLHPKYRVTYVNVVTALYNIFLSYIKHEEGVKLQEVAMQISK